MCTDERNPNMGDNTISEIMALKEMSLGGLEKKYEEVFDGKKAPSQLGFEFLFNKLLNAPGQFYV